MSELNIMDQVLSGIKGVETRLSQEFDGQIKKYEEQVRLNGEASAEAKTAVSELSKKFEDAMTEVGQKMASYKNQGETKSESAGHALVASEEFKSLVLGRAGNARIEVKNTINSVVGTTVYPQNMPGVIPGIFTPLTVRQVLPTGQTNAISVVGVREKSWSNKAAPVSQGGAKSETDIVFEQIQTPIETVAHWIKVSTQLLQDAPAVTAYIDTRLRFGLEAAIDAQLLVGNGTAPNLKGLTTTANPYTPTKGDNLADAINKAKYKLWSESTDKDSIPFYVKARKKNDTRKDGFRQVVEDLWPCIRHSVLAGYFAEMLQEHGQAKFSLWSTEFYKIRARARTHTHTNTKPLTG